MSLAAGALALAGRSPFGLSADGAQVALVAGPLMGLWPLSAVIWVAWRRPSLARHLPRLLGLWLLLAVLAGAWFGLRPLLG